MHARELQSPFAQRQRVRFRFSTSVLILLTVVAAGAISMLTAALQVPALSGEIRSFLGLMDDSKDPATARWAHLLFNLFLYCAPLGLALLVYMVHSLFQQFLGQDPTSHCEPSDPFE